MFLHMYVFFCVQGDPYALPYLTKSELRLIGQGLWNILYLGCKMEGRPLKGNEGNKIERIYRYCSLSSSIKLEIHRELVLEDEEVRGRRTL